MPVSAADILDFLRDQADRPLPAADILDHFQLTSRQRRTAQELIQELAGEGLLIRLKGDRYSLPRQINLVVGPVSAHRDGYGFVSPPDGQGPDVFIPARFMREAMNGDRVAVRVERRGREGKPEGRIVRVLQRAHQTMIGRYEAGGRLGFVIPSDPRLTHDLIIPPGAAGGARSGQLVVARIDRFPAKNRNPEGSITEVLGDPDDPEVEILAIVHKYGLPHRCPDDVLAAADRVAGTVGPGDLKGRVDLRSLPLVTIDGETAKDFDDAVAVAEEPGGAIRLWVAIADVGHYVAAGSPFDREALERGTSVYFPGRAIPMLPEALSNGICSLNPGVDRLVLTAEILFDREGERLEARFYPGVMHSRARLTYTGVQALLDRREAEAASTHRDLLPQLELMRELALRLMAMRRQRGSLDFDLPEAEIILDLRGRPENIIRSERTVAHRLIEEFMLAANEAVAAFLADRGSPLLYRIHEPPDPERLLALREFIAHFGFHLPLADGLVTPKQLQKLLAEVEGRPEERMINEVLLRSLKQARYAPENLGHFGLAADRYCHFTSPIRRYPDLVVHRLLREVLEKGELPKQRVSRLQQELPKVGEQTSHRERRAMDAEREIVDLKKCQFMADKVGEEFDGFVSGVQPFGFFVELKEIFVEGLVHISSLEDDFYHFEEDLHRLVGQYRRRIVSIGDEVRVRVVQVKLERREIDFTLADQAGRPAEETTSRRKKRQNRGH